MGPNGSFFFSIDLKALSKGATHHYQKGSSQVLRVDKEFVDTDAYQSAVSGHLPVIAKFDTSFED